MQTLGVSDSLLHSESRLKSLLWPSRSGSDVDYLGVQGYWVCAIVAVMTLMVPMFALEATHGLRHVSSVLLFGGIFFLFFYVGGIGVREGSRFAAAIVFVIYALDTGTYLITSPVSVSLLIKLAFTLVLFSNLRATWIAARWVPGAEESILPSRRSETFSDKFVDQWPQWVWPKIRIPYYVLSACVSFIMVLGYVDLLFDPGRWVV